MDHASDLDQDALMPRYLSQAPKHRFDFSVVTLVADETRYDRLVRSLRATGFTAENAELLAIDNRSANTFDGYTYLRRAMLEARGKYVILTHDDVEFLHDGPDELLQCLDDLTAEDFHWTIAGNAGSVAGRIVRHLDDPHGESRLSSATQVESLDENFLILRRERIVLHSLDLKGFHLYGADLCLQAELQGGTSYVVPFTVRHHSGGKIDAAFSQCRRDLAEKYALIFPHRRLHTTCGVTHIGGPGLVERWRMVGGATMRAARRTASRLRHAGRADHNLPAKAPVEPISTDAKQH